MTEYYIEAVRAYQGADKNLKHFAECCAKVEGKRTAALAADCKCSVDTIERYRNAYRLYYMMGVELESERCGSLWKAAPIGVWCAASKLKDEHNLTMAQTLEYIETGKNMNSKSFSAHVDEKESKIPKWIKRLRSVAKMLKTGDWMTEMSADNRERYERAVEAFKAELEAIAGDPAPAPMEER